MKPSKQFWEFFAIRGALTILASMFIFALPKATMFMLPVPWLFGLAIDCYATYSIFDAAVMVLLAEQFPQSAPRRKAAYVQAALRASVGALLYLSVYGVFNLHWSLWLVSIQAIAVAVVEMGAAQAASSQWRSKIGYITPLVLLLSSISLPFVYGLSPMMASFALASYVGLYGLSQFLVGARMLFETYQSEHPVPLAFLPKTSSAPEAKPAFTVAA